MKQPSFQFYPGDWLRDPALRSVSLAARGVWIDLLCLMHESTRRGYLIFPDGSAMKFEHLARIFSVDKRTLRGLIQELESCGVFSREGEVIYSRRMVRDQQLSEVRRKAGKSGGNPILLSEKDMQLDKQNEQQILTPSSSSSSSSSDNPMVPAKPKQTKPEPFDCELAFEELWAMYPAKGRTKMPLCQQVYTHIVAVLPEDQQAAMHAKILAPLRPGRAWAVSAKWAKGYVQGLDTYLSQRQWLESPESNEKHSGEEETIRFVPKPRPVETEPEEPLDLSVFDDLAKAVRQ